MIPWEKFNTMGDFEINLLLIIGCISFILGSLINYLVISSRTRKITEQLNLEFTQSQTELKIKNEIINKMEKEITKISEINDFLQCEVAQLKKEHQLDTERLQWIHNAQKEMREAFQALASQSLQVNSSEFIKYAHEQFGSLLGKTKSDWQTQKSELQGLVEPLRQNLTTVDNYIRELEQKREGAYQGLQAQLNQMTKAESELRNTTLTLTQALKSSSVRGRWGEVQLRRVVELAGMADRIAFQEQVTTDDGRPDMVIYLPNGGIIPIDSKAPMEAYIDSFTAKDEELRRRKMNDHVKAIRSRVNSLSQKKYWSQFEKSPDFVVMFVPSEACVGAAFELEPALLDHAFDQNVMITTPVTLLALLKVVAYGWQQYHLSENARKIANEAKEFYKRLENFTNNLGGIGSSLNKAVIDYNKTVGSFQSRLLPIARRLEALQVDNNELDAPNEIENSPRLVLNQGLILDQYQTLVDDKENGI